MQISRLNFPDLITAWEDLNELFVLAVKPRENLRDTYFQKNALYFYNVILDINKPIFPENFDIGRQFNYTRNKWSILISNYIDLGRLEELKSQIKQNMSKNKFYNISYSFDNNHAHGKNCLMNMVVTKRYGDPTPYITFYLRSSEVTKRLAVDFLLAKRIGDFLYENKEYKITFNILQLFQDNTVLLMYGAYKDLTPLLKNRKDERGIELNKKWEFIKTATEDDFKYKVHRRVFKVLRPDLYKYPKTKAKNCKLF